MGHVLLPQVGGGPFSYIGEEGSHRGSLCWSKVVYRCIVCFMWVM